MASAANRGPVTTTGARHPKPATPRSPKAEASDTHGAAQLAVLRPQSPAWTRRASSDVHASTRSGASPAPAPLLSSLRIADPDVPDTATPPPSVTGRRVTVSLNPVPMALGRFGANAELLVAPHHALVLSGYLQSFPSWLVRRFAPSNVDVGAGPASRPGGEIGYRFYTGGKEATGLFIGTSALAMPLAYPRITPNLRGDVVSFEGYGGALDIGFQMITDAGFTIGGGLGVMYVAYTPPASVTPPAGISVPSLAEPHVLPRLLFAAGWAF